VHQGPIVGVLLAAGSATRFGADKLLAVLPAGPPVGVAALKGLAAAVDHVVVVLRPGDAALAEVLREQGPRITVCADAARGMGASLAWGVRAAPLAGAWVIALADMPWVRSETIGAVVAALRSGAQLVAPAHRGSRGHPVGFAAAFYPELIALRGDEGAKSVLAAQSVRLIDTDDSAVLRDVDVPDDLAR
jgi:molybdenum cofactor cytidylyltransferase